MAGEELQFHGLLVTVPPPEHPLRQQLEKTEGFIDIRLCVLPPAHVYHSPNHPCVVALLAIETPIDIVVCDAGGKIKRERLDPFQMIELPSYAPYFFSFRSPLTQKAMVCIGYKYLGNSYTHERVPPVDVWKSEPLAFPYLLKGETFRLITGKEAIQYGGATCVIVGTIEESDGTKHEIASRVVWHAEKKAWALAHHSNGVLQEIQRDRASFSLRASKEQLKGAAVHCMKEGNEMAFMNMFMILAELLGPLGEQDIMGKLSQRYANIVGRVMTSNPSNTSISPELREIVMKTQSAIAQGQKNSHPLPPSSTSKPETKEADQQSSTCALGSCNKKDNLKRCGACKKVYYCSLDHQKDHWNTHKPTCKK